MFGFNLLALLAPTRQLRPSEADCKGFSVEPAVTNHEPGYVEVPLVEPVFVEPSLVPKPKPRRACGPRMVEGFNLAALRALAAAHHYLDSDDTLRGSAQAYNSNTTYTAAVVGLLRRNERALLDAALDGSISLLEAAYFRTRRQAVAPAATPATITVTDNN
jgi:hypothetical protein